MNKFNPLYLLLFSLILFIYSIINLNNLTTKLENTKISNKQYIKNGQKYNALQKAWGKKNNAKKKINGILKLANINNANIITNNRTIRVKIRNANLHSLDKFMNKILNDTIIILNFSLTKSSLDIEVGR